MAVLKILHYPDPHLRVVAKPVTDFGPALEQLVADLLDTRYSAVGIGLAANQVDVAQRVLVLDVSRGGGSPRCFVNPEIVELRGLTSGEEGCLSVPETFEMVERAEWIRVRAQNAQGVPFELECEGILAVCLQHEIDHLDGKLFVDRLSLLKRSRIRRKFDKAQRLAV